MSNSAGNDHTEYSWQWPNTGPAAVHSGTDSEIFDTEKFPYTQTFVREAIQNCLDARLDRARPVTVKFSFHKQSSTACAKFLADLHPKKAACKLPWPEEEWSANEVSWVVVEDSNTTGLKGDLSKRTSDFWNYWLNFGISNKDGKGRGGRGIGRVTFLIASRIHTVIGVTRRYGEPGVAVCGMSLLKPVEQGDEFKSGQAVLAKKELKTTYELYDDGAFLEGLISEFRVKDYLLPDSAGLSLIIPYPHSTLTPARIKAAAIEHFGPAVLAGALVLEVNGTVVNDQNIDAIALEVCAEFSSLALRDDPTRGLALERRSVGAADFSIEINQIGKKLEDSLTPEAKEKMRAHFDENGSASFDISIPVIRHGNTTKSRINAAVARCDAARKPIDLFFREGMCLPDVVAGNQGNVDLVVQASDGELVTYLNFCEGKAHLGLLENGEVKAKLLERGFLGNFAEKRFVRRLMDELRTLVLPDSSQPDATVFENFFSAPSEDVPRDKRKKKKRKSIIIPPIQPPKITPFIVTDLSSGFRVRANPEFQGWPRDLTVTAAYADGTASPKWNAYDFAIESLSVQIEGAAEQTASGNVIVCTNCGPETKLEVTGFDVRRELVVNVRSASNA